MELSAEKKGIGSQLNVGIMRRFPLEKAVEGSPSTSEITNISCTKVPVGLDILKGLKNLPIDRAFRIALAWYRSRDLEKVTLATHWLVSVDIQNQLKGLIEDLRNGSLEQVRAAKHILSALSELSVKTMVSLLEDPELHYVMGEILAKMDHHVLPHLIRWIDSAETFNTRTGIYRGLTGHLHDFRARKVFFDGLRSSDPLEAAFVCQALLESGAQGQRIIEIVLPQYQLLVA
jgi:hypothetical protein